MALFCLGLVDLVDLYKSCIYFGLFYCLFLKETIKQNELEVAPMQFRFLVFYIASLGSLKASVNRKRHENCLANNTCSQRFTKQYKTKDF